MGMTIGNYEVIKQIGEGGCARTYLAKHLILKEKACLKQNLDISPEDTKLLIKEAKLHKCDGVIGFGSGPKQSIIAKYFEKAGIPVCEIPGHNVDARQWDDEKIRATVSDFIETRIRK